MNPNRLKRVNLIHSFQAHYVFRNKIFNSGPFWNDFTVPIHDKPILARAAKSESEAGPMIFDFEILSMFLRPCQLTCGKHVTLYHVT